MSSFSKKLLNGFAWRLSLYVSSFILNICVANYLGAGKTGEFYLLISNLTYIILFFSAGIDGAIGYFNARKEIDPGKLFFFSIVWSLIAAVFIFLIYTVLINFSVLPGQSYVFIIVLYLFGNLLTNFLSALIYSMHNNKAPNIIFTVVNVLLISFVLFKPFSAFDFDAWFVPIYLLSGPVLAIIFTGFLIKKRIFPLATIPSQVYQQKFFSFAGKAFLFSMLYALLLRCDYWLIDFFCSESALGNYIQTTKLNQVIMFVPALASFTLFPLVVTGVHNDEEVEKKIGKLLNVYFYISLILCIVIAIGGYWVFPYLYGKSFSQMYPLFLLLAPGLILLACSSPLSTLFSGKDLLYFNIKSISIAILIMISADLILIPAFNVYGAAAGSTLAYASYFFMLISRFRKIHHFPLVELLQIKLMRNFIQSNYAKKIQ